MQGLNVCKKVPLVDIAPIKLYSVTINSILILKQYGGY